jgi:protein AroM
MLSRITFLTIGQTPRRDIVPEVVGALPRSVDVREMGALDGLDGDQVAELVPGPEDHALATLMRDGSQVTIGKRWVTGRIQEMLDAASRGPDEATVLLCTGEFPGVSRRRLFFDAQHLVDHGVAALSAGASTFGVVVPLARQEGEIHVKPAPGQTLMTAHASPYADDDFAAVGQSLSACDLIVMHCMGYTEAQREALARGSGRPVLLARRLVSSALAQLL